MLPGTSHRVGFNILSKCAPTNHFDQTLDTSMNRIGLLLFASLLLGGSACQKPPTPPDASNRAPSVAVPAPVTAAPTPKTTSPTAANEPVLSTEPIEYEGFRLTREFKTMKSEGTGREVETAYGVLKHGSKTVLVFDTPPSWIVGNEVKFALFPFLGQDRKQLYVELTAYRASEQWLIDLHPRFRVVYHSTDYGFYGGMQVMDIDHDGTFEFATRVTDYYNFADLAHCCSPDVTAILKFDQRASKYVPANYLFQEEALKGTDEELAKARATDKSLEFREHLLNVVLNYLYAGKEREGWEIFETDYNKPDKAELKRKIRQKLAHEPVFRYLHPHRTS